MLIVGIGCNNKYSLDEIEIYDERITPENITTRSIGGNGIEQAKQLISQMGYDVTKVEDKGMYFLVADKYRFYKDDISAFLLENPNNINSRIATSGNDTLGVHYRKINISAVYDSYGCNGYSHVASALTRWNNVGCDIQFNTEIGNNEHPDFPFNMTVEFVELYMNKNVLVNHS